MEYLDKALSRATDEGLETFSRAINGLAPRARECYSEIIHLENDEFVQMMVLDGSFIVQIVLIGNQFLTAEPNDPIFNQIALLLAIIRDKFLLENRIPFFVLELLFDLIMSSMEMEDSLVSISYGFLEILQLNKQSSNETPRHLLHLLMLRAFPKPNRLPTDPTIEEIPSATRLRKAGVKFKCINENSFLDIVFEDGELRITPLQIGDEMFSLLPNLIAFEQCYINYCGLYITAYVCFMNWLIDSADDVLILRRKGIIKNWLGSDEEVADLFNKLGRDVSPLDEYFYLSDVVKDINHYHRSRCHSWRASLLRPFKITPLKPREIPASNHLPRIAFFRKS